MQGAEAIATFFKEGGMTHSFGVVGESVLEFIDSIRDDPEFEYIPVRHEQAGALAASGYARNSRRPALCLGHIGAGASNLVNGMADAYKDDVPVVALTGNDDTENLGRDVWHEVDHQTMFEPVTEWNVRITHVERIPQVMREAMTRLNTGTPGPIHIDLPTDVAQAELPPETEAELEDALATVPGPESPHDSVAPAESEVSTAVDRFLDAEMPLVLAGNETVWARAGDLIESLATYASAPVLTSLPARGVISEHHEYCFGALGTLGRIAAKEVADEADFVLALGSELTDLETFGWSLFEDSEIVQVLQSDEALGRQYSVDQTVPANTRAFAEAFEAELRERTDGPLSEPAEMDRFRESLQSELDAVENPDPENLEDTENGLVNPYAPLKAIVDAKEPNDVICSASGKNTLWSSLLPIAEPGTFLKSVGLGTMGFAFPGGIGAQAASTDATVFVVAGDGDFSMVAQELETCVREDLPVIVVVFNDDELSSIKTQQGDHYDERYIGVDYTDVDFSEVAEGFGAHGTRVTTGQEFAPALEEAQSVEGPALIDVKTDPTIEAPSLFYEVQ